MFEFTAELGRPSKKTSQFVTELFIDEQVDEEVNQVADVVGVAKVSADQFIRNDCVDGRSEGEDEDEEQTETDLHRLHVTRLRLYFWPVTQHKFSRRSGWCNAFKIPKTLTLTDFESLLVQLAELFVQQLELCRR